MKRRHCGAEELPAQFVERLKVRDVEATTELVETYTVQLLRASYGLGFREQEAKDLVQEVWAAFLEAVTRFEGRSHIRTFLFGILYNKSLERRRVDSRISPTDDIDTIMESHFDADGRWANPPIDPERFMQASQTMAIIRECLDSLPLPQRMAFSLREIEDQSTTDICNIMSVTVTNLGVLLFRAKNRLRTCIEKKAGPIEEGS